MANRQPAKSHVFSVRELWPGPAGGLGWFLFGAVAAAAALTAVWFALDKPVSGMFVALTPVCVAGHALAAGLFSVVVGDWLILRKARRQVAVMKVEPDEWPQRVRRRCHEKAGSSQATLLCGLEYESFAQLWITGLNRRRRYLFILSSLVVLPAAVSIFLTITPEFAQTTPLVMLGGPMLLGLAEAFVLSILLFDQEERVARLFSFWKNTAAELDESTPPLVGVPKTIPAPPSGALPVEPKVIKLPATAIARESGDGPIEETPDFDSSPGALADRGPPQKPAGPHSDGWQTVTRVSGDD